jgi:hypothetical protein
MAEDDEPKPTLDPDRAAILERRKRFIALALTGLSTAACDSRPLTKPDPCLKGVPRGQQEEEEDDGPAPHPCLSVPIQPDPPSDPPPETPPQVCLKIAQPPAETGDDGAAAPEPTPQPCLSKPIPRPCLKRQTPQPCLKMAEPE